MNPLPLQTIAEMCGGRPPAAGGGKLAASLSKDTRTLRPGDLYWALRGEHFDGNRFAAEAAARGAVGAVLDSPEAAASLPPDFPVVLVADGLEALRRLAAAWRAQLRARVVCVTGSNGKTSTKDFTAAVLGSAMPVARTRGNLNNHIGVPLTILEAAREDLAAVWEIAMNHAGEIAPLAALAQPEIGMITGIGVAHIEHLGSREAIAREKGMLFEALPPEGLAILPDRCEFASSLASRTRARVERVGGPGCRIRAEDLALGPDGSAFTLVIGEDRARVTLPVPGAHMVSNALLAAAAAEAFGLTAADCARALSSVELTAGRLTLREIRGVRILDDTYNANPDSMEAALEVLRQSGGGRRFAVLGKMGELGDYAAEGCRRVGRAAARCADELLAVGAEAAPMAEAAAQAGMAGVRLVETPDQAADLLRSEAKAGDVILVKGSRSARMELFIQSF
ncbi:MAG: UDP-N-acetylmuramoyl-tripeptide--D-alanyl-D-alanine ligase [Terrimicrobiaceae bacterium]|nr:UDP-N-acetylmuramoyl-tripeptide--D-alanyl-D-alanine ligase [Terrimicrobiaceae bacterium]